MFVLLCLAQQPSHWSLLSLDPAWIWITWPDLSADWPDTMSFFSYGPLEIFSCPLSGTHLSVSMRIVGWWILLWSWEPPRKVHWDTRHKPGLRKSGTLNTSRAKLETTKRIKTIQNASTRCTVCCTMLYLVEVKAVAVVVAVVSWGWVWEYRITI